MVGLVRVVPWKEKVRGVDGTSAQTAIITESRMRLTTPWARSDLPVPDVVTKVHREMPVVPKGFGGERGPSYTIRWLVSSKNRLKEYGEPFGCGVGGLLRRAVVRTVSRSRTLLVCCRNAALPVGSQTCVFLVVAAAQTVPPIVKVLTSVLTCEYGE